MAVSGSRAKGSHAPSIGGEGAALFGEEMEGMTPRSAEGFGGEGGEQLGDREASGEPMLEELGTAFFFLSFFLPSPLRRVNRKRLVE